MLINSEGMLRALIRL